MEEGKKSNKDVLCPCANSTQECNYILKTRTSRKKNIFSCSFHTVCVVFCSKWFYNLGSKFHNDVPHSGHCVIVLGLLNIHLEIYIFDSGNFLFCIILFSQTYLWLHVHLTSMLYHVHLCAFVQCYCLWLGSRYLHAFVLSADCYLSFALLIYFLIFLFVVLEIGFRALCIKGKSCVTQLHP